ncbi:rRNA large subunit methyltransferase I, partial [Verrucomicrobia bacterium]|nr:rRNA large subunit methyltransferase I [Verrucomicrobiota bacterium]
MSKRHPTSLPTVTIKLSKAPRIHAGHPWIFNTDIRRLTDEIPDGSEVQVRDDKRRTLGVGFYNSQSKIVARILSRQKRPLDNTFFRERLETAIALRKSHELQLPCYRLVNSESDFLSGMIIDIYDKVAVIQISSLALDQRKKEILNILDELMNLDVILEKKDPGTRRFEQLDEGVEFHKGQA